MNPDETAPTEALPEPVEEVLAERLTALARKLGARKPRRVPRSVARLFGGAAAAVMMTELRGASNVKGELGRQPRWREGFASVHAGQRDGLGS